MLLASELVRHTSQTIYNFLGIVDFVAIASVIKTFDIYELCAIESRLSSKPFYKEMSLTSDIFDERIDPDLGVSRISSVFSFVYSKLFIPLAFLLASIFLYTSIRDSETVFAAVSGFALTYILLLTIFFIRRLYDDVYIDYKSQKIIAKGNWKFHTVEQNFSNLQSVKKRFSKFYLLKFHDGSRIIFRQKERKPILTTSTYEELKALEMIINRDFR